MNSVKIAQFFRELFDSPATQPLLTLWLVGGVTATMRAAGWFNYSVSILIITGALIILVLSSFRKELSDLHEKVNSTTDDMVKEVHDVIDSTKDQLVKEVHDVIDSTQDDYVNRIIQLTALLVSNNIEVPSEIKED